MNKKQVVKLVFSLIFTSIWMIVALILWFMGFNFFREELNGGDAFGAWFFWGALCVIPILFPIMKSVFSSAKSGARQGARTYSASWSGNTVTVQNHPIRGAIYGFIGGIIGGVLGGPLLLAIYVIVNTIKLITTIIELVREVKR